MIAAADFRYGIDRAPSPWPAMVRERVGSRLEGAPDGIPGEDDDDELYLLGERIAELAARINAAESRMMTLIADFDRRGGWKDGGYGSCAEWLAWRIGIKIGPARERVRTARALESLPQTADALRDGRISYAKARALTRVATPECEAELLEYARAGSAAKLEQRVRMWKMLSRDEELTAEQARHRSRAFSMFVDGDGMHVVKGRLEPEVGAVLMRAVEAASDALFRCEGGAAADHGGGRASAGSREGDDGNARPDPQQRRADAVGLLAERALAVGFEGGGPRDARVESGTRAERYQVMVHCDAATLAAEGEPGRSDLDGIRVSAETSRRMACDAAVVGMVHVKEGEVLNVGRRTRTIPPHIRRALEERDRGCRFPGCGCRFTEAHHVKHWADGGETSLRNTLLLCRRHHRAVHEGQVKVSVNSDGTVLFFTPKGRMLVDAPKPRGRADAWNGSEPVHAGREPKEVDAALPPVPSAHPGATLSNGHTAMSNGAALYPDSAIPWAIEAAARDAMEESLES